MKAELLSWCCISTQHEWIGWNPGQLTGLKPTIKLFRRLSEVEVW